MTRKLVYIWHGNSTPFLYLRLSSPVLKERHVCGKATR